MSVRIESTTDDRISVLRGLDSDAALRHLAHSLIVGVPFGDRRGLVIDLGGCQPSTETADLLRAASQERLRHHQVVTAAADARELPRVVSRTRHWMDRVDRSGTDIVAAVKGDLSSLCGLVEAGLSIARSLMVRLLASAAGRNVDV